MTIDKICFLGFCVDKNYFDHYSKNDKNPQIAAYKFESRLIYGLRQLGLSVDVYATLASSTFPKNKNIYFPSDKKTQKEEMSTTMALLNVPGIKLLYRFGQAILNLSSWARGAKGTTVVCIYSAHTPYLLAAYLISVFFNIPYFVVIPDLPMHMGVNGKRNFLIQSLKRLDSTFIDWLIKKSSGVAILTEAMIRDKTTWGDLPYIVTEGICEESPTVFSNHQESSYLLYAGGLHEQYGVRMLVDSFIKSNLKIELWLCGRGALEGYIRDIAKKDSRIKYLGFLDSSTLSRIQANSKAMIITRDPQEIYTKYSFPSKLLEYMLSGIPVLTTRLEGIPAQFFDYLLVIEAYDSSCIIKGIENLLQRDEMELKDLAIKGREFVLARNNPTAVSTKLVSLMTKALDKEKN